LLFTCQRWPTAALLADAFSQSGLQVGALRPAGHPMAALGSVGFQKHYWHPRRHALLAGAIATFRPDLIVPCDDFAVTVLHEHHARSRGVAEAQARAALIERSLGDPAMFETVRKKSRFVALAQSRGVVTPQTRVVRDANEFAAAIADGPWPQVVKADGWSGGRGTFVAHNAAEARTAYGAVHAARSVLTMAKDAIRERSFMPLYRRALAADAAVTLQAFAPGRPVSREVMCWRGQVIAGRTFEAVETMPNNGHSTVVRVRRIAVVETAVERCVALLGLSGVAGFDFIYDAATDVAFLLEVNARATAGAYAAPLGSPPLAKALADMLIGFPNLPDAQANRAAEAAVPERLIALFPQELERDPHSPYLAQADHVVPTHAPDLVAECIRQAAALAGVSAGN
jgi:hypothetical protein